MDKSHCIWEQAELFKLAQGDISNVLLHKYNY